MILVITPQTSSRLKYVFDFITKCYPKVEFSILAKKANSTTQDGLFTVGYGTMSADSNNVFVESCGLLFENDIKPINDLWNKDKDCLEHFVDDTEIGFDIFSAIFYQLSRYEEYLPSRLDEHGRFSSEESCVVKAGGHMSPWVDIYIDYFFQQLKRKYPEFPLPEKNWTYKATMDVDIAYEYLGRNIVRTLGGLGRNILRPKRLLDQLMVLLRFKKDPSFIFDKMAHVDIIYFIHVGDYGPLDKSCGLSRKEYQSFLQGLKKESIGLHPSFQSHLDLDELLFEVQQLEEIADQSIYQSRQHFIKMILPETYEMLPQIGVTKEYSMGWPDLPGFRAGTTHPHYFFNIKTNQQSDLELFPFAWMDAHFIYHGQTKKLKETFNQIKALHKKYGGCFTPVFHNNHFSKSAYGATLYQLLNELSDS